MNKSLHPGVASDGARDTSERVECFEECVIVNLHGSGHEIPAFAGMTVLEPGTTVLEL